MSCIFHQTHTNFGVLLDLLEKRIFVFPDIARRCEPSLKLLGPPCHHVGTEPWLRAENKGANRFLMMMVAPGPRCAWSPDMHNKLPLMLRSTRFESLLLVVKSTDLKKHNTTQHNKIPRALLVEEDSNCQKITHLIGVTCVFSPSLTIHRAHFEWKDVILLRNEARAKQTPCRVWFTLIDNVNWELFP